MTPSTRAARPSALWQLQELPGIADVVWATVTRLASAPVPTSVLFTAAEERAGTTVLAAATAIGLAQHQRTPVCLLETNVRHPALARYLGLESVGLSDVLDGRAELEDCLQEPRGCPGLLVLPAGTPRAPVSGEFTTARLTSTLARLEQACHYLILDAAPVLDHVETRLLLHHADAVLLVLRARSTRRSDAERALGILVESGAPVLGSIFNDYRGTAALGGSARASPSFPWAARAERPRAHAVFPGRHEEPTNGGTDASPAEPFEVAAATNGDLLPTNGGPALEVLAPGEGGSEAAHRREIDVLQRRIVKLTHQLAQTEADLRHLAAMKNVDMGISSIYRGVQGLSSEEEALAQKRLLMQQIFKANLDLKSAMARRS